MSNRQVGGYENKFVTHEREFTQPLSQLLS